MSDDGVSLREVAEALVCVAKILVLVQKIFPDWTQTLVDLEDELADYYQEQRG